MAVRRGVNPRAMAIPARNGEARVVALPLGGVRKRLVMAAGAAGIGMVVARAGGHANRALTPAVQGQRANVVRAVGGAGRVDQKRQQIAAVIPDQAVRGPCFE